MNIGIIEESGFILEAYVSFDLEEENKLLLKMLNKRVKVEEALWECAAGKRPFPDKDQLVKWAKELGYPKEYL